MTSHNRNSRNTNLLKLEFRPSPVDARIAFVERARETIEVDRAFPFFYLPATPLMENGELTAETELDDMLSTWLQLIATLSRTFTIAALDCFGAFIGYYPPFSTSIALIPAPHLKVTLVI